MRSSFNVTSGELLYRLCGLDKVNLIPEVAGGNQLQKFLETKLPTNGTAATDELAIVRKLRAQVETSHLANVNYIGSAVVQEVSTAGRAILMEAVLEKERVATALSRQQKVFEASAMQSVLKFVSVVKEDIATAKKQLDEERQQKGSLKKQAKVCRDFLMFCRHVHMESSGRIEITCLPHNSAQFGRCVNAVHENLTDGYGVLTSKRKIAEEDVRVLNVFKMKNNYLSRQLQAATARAPGCKVKGMFCCLSAEHIFAFSVHGLAVQWLPNGNIHSIDANKHVFGAPWVFASASPLVPLNPELLAAHSISGAAAKLSRRRSGGPMLRFGRFSSISTITACTEEEREHGLFLSLCRVLVNKQKVVTGFIEESDILEALEQGYDAVFSTTTEESVLLQPAHVLPEFLIHIFFRNVDCAETYDDHNSKLNSLLAMLTPSGDTAYDDCGAEMTLLGNECAGRDKKRRPKTNVSRKPAGMDAQEAVRIKQTALIKIETAMDEFREQKRQLIVESGKRLLEAINT